MNTDTSSRQHEHRFVLLPTWRQIGPLANMNTDMSSCQHEHRYLLSPIWTQIRCLANMNTDTSFSQHEHRYVVLPTWTQIRPLANIWPFTSILFYLSFPVQVWSLGLLLKDGIMSFCSLVCKEVVKLRRVQRWAAEANRRFKGNNQYFNSNGLSYSVYMIRTLSVAGLRSTCNIMPSDSKHITILCLLGWGLKWCMG